MPLVKPNVYIKIKETQKIKIKKCSLSPSCRLFMRSWPSEGPKNPSNSSPCNQCIDQN